MREIKAFNEREAIIEASRCLNCVEALCTKGCPADVDARGFIQALLTGNMTDAIRSLKEYTILPLSCALVCPVERQCEGECRATELAYPIRIAAIQRYIAEQDLEHDYYRPEREEANGIKVAVVGAGPGGLAAAAELNRLGYSVTIFEKQDRAGGMLTGGIPSYRLPVDMPNREIEYIARQGVEIKTGITVDSIDELESQGFKSVVLAIGLWSSAKLGIPGEEGANSIGALGFLNDVAHHEAYDVPVGKRVLVIGGGSVAMDAAGSALRCGAESVDILCLESPSEMPSTHEEMDHAISDGAVFHYRAKPLEVIRDGDVVKGLKAKRIKWNEPGKYIPSNAVELEGTEFVVPCDTLIVAIGQRLVPGNLFQDLDQNRGKLVVNDQMMTSRPGVFAAGDAVAGGGMTVIKAIQEGQAAANGIDAYLKVAVS